MQDRTATVDQPTTTTDPVLDAVLALERAIAENPPPPAPARDWSNEPELKQTRPVADVLAMIPERDQAELRAACDVIADLAPTVELLGVAFDRFRLAREVIDGIYRGTDVTIADRMAADETFDTPVGKVLDVLYSVEEVLYRSGV